MSSIAIFFQTVVELVSPCQVIRHLEPSLKLSPGAGSVGITSARAKNGSEKTRSAIKAFMVYSFFKKNGIVGSWLVYIISVFKGMCVLEGSEVYSAVVCVESLAVT